MRKRFVRKKPKNMAVSVCAALLVTAMALSGCGEADIEVEERSPILEDADRANTFPGNQDENPGENPSEDNQEEEISEENLLSENGDSKESAKLIGIVVSISENSMVVNETLVQESDGFLLAASSGEDVTVFFSENADYIFKTVKNSGMNEDTDVESREGSFADIRENITVEMTGVYKDGDFIAEHVIISEFI